MQDFCEDYRNFLTNIGSSIGKESASNAGDTRDTDSILGSGRSAWEPVPVFLARESHGQRSLAGYRP